MGSLRGLRQAAATKISKLKFGTAKEVILGYMKEVLPHL